jgi:signal transduction histidine kinase
MAYLSFDRLGSELQLTPTRVDPVHLVSVVAAEWEPHRLQVQCANVPASFVCDSSLLRIAMRNLINNAMRHSPKDVPVTLQVSGMENGGIEIAVTDEGEGVPGDEIPKLFQKYFRGRGAQSHPGAGLGLYLVERIAQLHGGTVRLESRPTHHRGSRFILSLPGSPVPHQR